MIVVEAVYGAGKLRLNNPIDSFVSEKLMSYVCTTRCAELSGWIEVAIAVDTSCGLPQRLNPLYRCITLALLCKLCLLLPKLSILQLFVLRRR